MSSFLIRFSSNLQINRTGIKSQKSLKFGHIRLITVELPTLKCWKALIWPCLQDSALEHCLFSFDWLFMEVADNLDRHKISDKLEFRHDRSVHFGVTCPWVPKKATYIFDFVQSIACVIFIQSLWNLQINRAGIKYLTSWKLDRIAILTLELNALDCWHAASQVSDCCPLGCLFTRLDEILPDSCVLWRLLGTHNLAENNGKRNEPQHDTEAS